MQMPSVKVVLRYHTPAKVTGVLVGEIRGDTDSGVELWSTGRNWDDVVTADF